MGLGPAFAHQRGFSAIVCAHYKYTHAYTHAHQHTCTPVHLLGRANLYKKRAALAYIYKFWQCRRESLRPLRLSVCVCVSVAACVCVSLPVCLCDALCACVCN